jgi:hypothetical protein
MKKILVGIALLVLTLTTGCGTWCSKDRMYCMDGFTGVTRYAGYNTAYYYPFTVFTITNGSHGNYSMDVLVDGIMMGPGLGRGETKRIEIKSPPNKDRPATVLIKRYRKGKPAGNYTSLIQLSSTRSATYSWVIDERYFPGWR